MGILHDAHRYSLYSTCWIMLLLCATTTSCQVDADISYEHTKSLVKKVLLAHLQHATLITHHAEQVPKESKASLDCARGDKQAAVEAWLGGPQRIIGSDFVWFRPLYDNACDIL